MINMLNPYSILIDVKNYLYDQKIFQQIKTKNQTNTKIISIGNLNTGGSGKTPMIQYFVETLIGTTKSEKKILIVCKSYKAKLKKPSAVDLSNAQAVAIYGDEACLLQKLLPQCEVWSGPHKSETVLAALNVKNNYDVIFIDDGFSHRKLFRHRDVILVDASRSRAHYRLFPLGHMREGWKTLKRSDLVILTKTENLTKENRVYFQKHMLPFQKNLIEAEFKSSLVSENKKIFLITGIGNPEKLKSDLIQQGYSVQSEKIYPDHFAFPETEQIKLLADIEKKSELQAVMTAKDLIKITNTELLKKIKTIDLKINFSEESKALLNEKILS